MTADNGFEEVKLSVAALEISPLNSRVCFVLKSILSVVKTMTCSSKDA